MSELPKKWVHRWLEMPNFYMLEWVEFHFKPVYKATTNSLFPFSLSNSITTNKWLCESFSMQILWNSVQRALCRKLVWCSDGFILWACCRLQTATTDWLPKKDPCSLCQLLLHIEMFGWTHKNPPKKYCTVFMRLYYVMQFWKFNFSRCMSSNGNLLYSG